MAKFEEYAEKYLNTDGLDAEIEQAAQESTDRKADNPTLPERFQGKSAEEIAASYTELETAYSRQGNDLGQLRTTMDEFIRLQSQPAPQQEIPKADPVSIDDIYDDPNAAIRKVVDEVAGDKIAKLEAALETERFNGQMAGLDAKYDGWRNLGQTPEFVNWAQSNSYRARMAAEGNAGDLGAADALLEMWYDQHGPAAQEKERAQRDTSLRNAELESGGTDGGFDDDDWRMSRHEIMTHRIAAKRGDQTSDMWLKSNAERIAIAYEENRVTD